MYKRATARSLIATVGLAWSAWAQAPQPTPDWRHIGNSAVDESLCGLASGAVARVWYSRDGATLFLQTGSGRLFQTADLENWRPSVAVPPASADSAPVQRLPEPGAQVRMPPAQRTRAYAFGNFVYRSDDGG